MDAIQSCLFITKFLDIIFFLVFEEMGRKFILIESVVN